MTINYPITRLPNYPMRIAVIPGDGIGVEMTAEAVKAIRAVGEVFGRQFDLEMLPWGADHFLQTGVTIPPDGYAMLRDQFDAIFIGALGDPRVPDNRHARDILLGTRFELDLYVNYRPVKLLDERLCPLKDRTPADVNFVVFRENTEGLYVSIGGRFKAGTEDEIAIQEEINTYKGVHRIIRHAFEFAKANGRRSVCMADKSNAMAAGPRAVAARVQGGRAAVSRTSRRRHLYIDALALLLVQNPAQFERHRHQQPVRRHHHRPRRRRCRAGWAWRRRATSIPARRRCSSRCTARRRRWPGRTSRIPMGAILSAALMLEHARAGSRSRRRSKRPCRRPSRAGRARRISAASLGTRETGDCIAAHIRRRYRDHEDSKNSRELATKTSRRRYDDET